MIVSHSLRSVYTPLRGACVALGFFDGVHLGHQAVLGAAVSGARRLGITAAAFTFSIRGRAPEAKRGMRRLMSGNMLRGILEETGISYMAVPDFDEIRGFSPDEFVRDVLAGRLGAARVVCGYNFHFGENASGNADTLRRLCDALDISAEIIPAVEIDGGSVSSSRIRALISEGDILSANKLLGRPFAIDFPVIAGRQLGRTLEWPTINQSFPDNFTVPRHGVYATLAHAGGKICQGVTNVGCKPTVGSGAVLAETFIQGFDGDLYGKRVRLEFLRFLRPERKFESMEELKAQIARDARDAIGIKRGDD